MEHPFFIVRLPRPRVFGTPRMPSAKAADPEVSLQRGGDLDREGNLVPYVADDSYVALLLRDALLAGWESARMHPRAI